MLPYRNPWFSIKPKRPIPSALLIGILMVVEIPEAYGIPSTLKLKGALIKATPTW